MGLGMTIALLVVGWLTVAAAMLWGVLRISRRHHRPEAPVERPVEARIRHSRHVSSH